MKSFKIGHNLPPQDAQKLLDFFIRRVYHANIKIIDKESYWKNGERKFALSFDHLKKGKATEKWLHITVTVYSVKTEPDFFRVVLFYDLDWTEGLVNVPLEIEKWLKEFSHIAGVIKVT